MGQAALCASVLTPLLQTEGWWADSRACARDGVMSLPVAEHLWALPGGTAAGGHRFHPPAPAASSAPLFLGFEELPACLVHYNVKQPLGKRGQRERKIAQITSPFALKRAFTFV